MTWNVLVSAPYFLPIVEQWRPYLEEAGCRLHIADVQERLEEEDLLPIIGEIHGVICGDDRFTPRVIEAADNLKVISKWGTGVDSIDAEACAARGIAICRTPNAFSEPVADSVLGYTLMFLRKLPWMDRHMKSGHWEKIPGRAMNDITFGIIGVGDVGSAVARRVGPTGARLLGNDLRDTASERAEMVRQTGIEMVDLDTVLAESDVISVNTDLNPTSHHLITTETLAKMKPGAILINAARGPVVDEPALIDALQSGHLGGAALDVFEDEPLPASSPLREMDHVFLAPHNSNSSPRAWEAVHKSTIENMLRELRR